jgi:phospholipid/cholesterol/gamma-HCH transport system substrate-binding protein/paraquat-inducible protein B
MSTRPNYFKLGVFILVALVLLVAGIVLFGSGVMGQEKIYFETYFKESVSGLTPGAPVQDNGVEIGTVERISFIRHDYADFLPDGFSKYRPFVRVVCSVRGENLPEMTHQERQKSLDILVKNGLRLRLSTNILTGQGFIEAEYVSDPSRFPVESFPWETEYPYIPSAPSTFTTLKDSVDKILHRLEKIETEKIAENINEVLVSVNKAVNDAQIKTMRAEAGKLVAEIRQTNQHLIELLKNPAPEEELSNIADLVDRMDQMIARIDSLVRMNTPQIIEMLESFKQISDNLKGLTEDLEKSPSMIFSEPPERKEMP